MLLPPLILSQFTLATPIFEINFKENLCLKPPINIIWLLSIQALPKNGTQPETGISTPEMLHLALAKKCGGYVPTGMNGKQPYIAEAAVAVVRFATDPARPKILRL
jgi:hypothetical protein